MNPAEIHRHLETNSDSVRDHAQEHNDLIALIFQCDVTTAHNIVNRVAHKLGAAGTDAIVVLKAADPLIIASCILDELRSNMRDSPKSIYSQYINPQPAP